MGDDTEEIQIALYELGIYKSAVDGIDGPKTRQAIKEFQSINPPLVVDGDVGPATGAILFPENFKERDEDNVYCTDYVAERAQRLFPHYRNCRQYYGTVGSQQVKIDLPYPMKLAWDTGVTVDKMTCHQRVSREMRLIFQKTLDTYGHEKIKELGLDLFGGCLNVRKMRGGQLPSTHSWGIAVDLHPSANQLRWDHTKALFAGEEYNKFFDIVEECGAVPFGRAKDYDWMHIQFARI